MKNQLPILTDEEIVNLLAKTSQDTHENHVIKVAQWPMIGISSSFILMTIPAVLVTVLSSLPVYAMIFALAFIIPVGIAPTIATISHKISANKILKQYTNGKVNLRQYIMLRDSCKILEWKQKYKSEIEKALNPNQNIIVEEYSQNLENKSAPQTLKQNNFDYETNKDPKETLNNEKERN